MFLRVLNPQRRPLIRPSILGARVTVGQVGVSLITNWETCPSRCPCCDTLEFRPRCSSQAVWEWHTSPQCSFSAGLVSFYTTPETPARPPRASEQGEQCSFECFLQLCIVCEELPNLVYPTESTGPPPQSALLPDIVDIPFRAEHVKCCVSIKGTDRAPPCARAPLGGGGSTTNGACSSLAMLSG